MKNWKEIGGPDRRIAFFNKEPGRGTWEVFAHWLYGNPKKVPQSMGGLVTGSLLGLARAAGETAPIMFTATIFGGATLPHALGLRSRIACTIRRCASRSGGNNAFASPEPWPWTRRSS